MTLALFSLVFLSWKSFCMFQKISLSSFKGNYNLLFTPFHLHVVCTNCEFVIIYLKMKVLEHCF